MDALRDCLSHFQTPLLIQDSQHRALCSSKEADPLPRQGVQLAMLPLQANCNAMHEVLCIMALTNEPHWRAQQLSTNNAEGAKIGFRPKVHCLSKFDHAWQHRDLPPIEEKSNTDLVSDIYSSGICREEVSCSTLLTALLVMAVLLM